MRSGSSHCDLQLAKMKHEEYEEEEAGGGRGGEGGGGDPVPRRSDKI